MCALLSTVSKEFAPLLVKNSPKIKFHLKYCDEFDANIYIQYVPNMYRLKRIWSVFWL